jgi:O-antigen/teichoic acid export membrane protein
MRLRHALPAGLLDAGFASLATLGVGVYAARTLTDSDLGAYALFFSAFVLAAVVPSQLVLVPAEFATLPVARIERLGLLRQTWRLGLPTAVIAAVVAALAAILGAKAPSNLLLPLAVGTVACGVFSPLQDHLRRVLHLAGVSWWASCVSAVQLLSVAGYLGLFALAKVPTVWRPFGALALANLTSLAIGFLLARRELHAFVLPRFQVGEAIRSGRWLVLVEVATAGAMFLSAVGITHLSSPAALGYAEAARIVAQPILVLTTGLTAVLGPRSMEAAAARDRLAAGRVLLPFTLLLVLVSLAYGAVTVTQWSGNPVGVLVPQAYAVSGLVPFTVFALMLNGGAMVFRSELLGGGWARVLPQVGTVAAVLQCLAAATAVSIGGFARPLGVALFGMVLLVGYQWQRRAMYSTEAVRDEPSKPVTSPSAPSRTPRGSRRSTSRLRKVASSSPGVARYNPFETVGRTVAAWSRAVLDGAGGSVRVDRLPVGLDEGPGLVASVWRYRLLVAVVMLLGVAVGLGLSTRQAVMYEGASQILLTAPSADATGQAAEPDRYVRNQAAFMVSPPVLARAVRLAKGRVSVRQLREQLTAEPSQELDLVTVRVRDRTAQGAAELANAVGRAYAETAVQQARASANRTVEQLRATEAALRGELTGLQAKGRAAPNDRAVQVELDTVAGQLGDVLKQLKESELEGAVGSPVSLLEPAEVPAAPAQPKPLRLAAAGGLLGFVLAAGLAWSLNSRRQAPAGGQARPEWPYAASVSSPRTRAARARIVVALRSRPPKGGPGTPTVALAEQPTLLDDHRTIANGSGQVAHSNGHVAKANGSLGPSITIEPSSDLDESNRGPADPG